MEARNKSSLALVALLACTLVGACSPAPARPKPPRNLLLIVVDTLGARSVSLHDAGVTFTPHLETLRERRTTVFAHAYSTAPWTKPSIGSIFTGLYPSEHGLTDMPQALAPPVPTLAERLAAQGFQTHGVVSHTLIRKGTGFERGFAEYVNVNRHLFPHETITSPEVTDEALRWLDARAPAREGEPQPPFFLFTHYFDPHYAYKHHAEYDRSAWYQGDITPDTDFETLLDRAIAGDLSQDDLRYLRSLYQEEVAFTDEHIGRLLSGMRERGLLDDTLVVFTGDHGEEFGDHGSIGHTKTLYQELVHVPLVVSFPGPAQVQEADEVVSTLDLLPTVLDLYGLPPAERATGRSLVPLLRDPGGHLGRGGVYAEVSYTATKRHAMKVARIEPGRKLIHDAESGRYEYYDLQSDPHEQDDRFDASRPEQERMQHALERFRSVVQGTGAADGTTIEFDAHELEALRRMGYF